MINAEIKIANQTTLIGSSYNADNEDLIHLNCIHAISFDRRELIITSTKKNEEICSISFKLTSEFVDELECFLSALKLSLGSK